MGAFSSSTPRPEVLPGQALNQILSSQLLDQRLRSVHLDGGQDVHLDHLPRSTKRCDSDVHRLGCWAVWTATGLALAIRTTVWLLSRPRRRSASRVLLAASTCRRVTLILRFVAILSCLLPTDHFVRDLVSHTDNVGDQDLFDDLGLSATLLGCLDLSNGSA